MVRDCGCLRLFTCASRILTANRCASLSITEKEAKIALPCFRKEAWIFFGHIGRNTDQIILKDICFTPEAKINIFLLHDPLTMRLTSTRRWLVCRNPIRFTPYGIVLPRICWSPGWKSARSKNFWGIPLSKPRLFIFT